MPCPLCRSTGGNRRSFPTDRLRRLDDRIRGYHDDAEYEIVVILVTAFLEAILEDILDRILSARGADVELRRLVLDAQRSIGQRIGHLFPELTGSEFEAAAEKLGFREFPYRWREMRGARNAFIHDSPFHGPQETIDRDMGEDAMLLLSQAYELFVSLNNEYVADHRKKPSA
jgi:hypothetical protein